MKVIKFLSVCIFFNATFGVFAQRLDLSKPIPMDKSIRKGVLANGLTYYIKHTDVVKEAASFYIIQNVGSVLENDDQQGLAHFLEHMAFNGTKNFKGKGILETFQKEGLLFGKDINAYTSFDETVYNINNVPTRPELIDKGLLVLHDWCNYLLLTDEEIDAERGVIKEEWRTRQDGTTRLFKISSPITFNHSKYSKRLPIGLMRIVENFEYKALRDFYHDWYRTDLQAIAVIGDIDVDEIEVKIKKIFSKIPAVKNPRERFIVEIPENDALLYSLGTDPEISTSQVDFGIRHKKSLNPQTIKDLKMSLLESMVTSMISSRISDKARKPQAPFLASLFSYDQIARKNNSLNLLVVPKLGKQKEAFSAALTEVIRGVKFGFTRSEITRQIKKIKNSYETQIAKKEDRSHGQIIGQIKKNYLNNATISDIEKEYDLVENILNNLTIQELHNTLKRLYTKNNRYVNVIGVKGKNNLTEKQVKQIIKDTEKDATITPYTEALEGKTLLSGVDIKPGKIIKSEKNAALGSTTYHLSNGVKVHYKFVDKEKNKVNIKALSYGGTSLLTPKDIPSSSIVRDFINMSGLGAYSSTELPKILAGKTASVWFLLLQTQEQFGGSATTKDVETMLQLLHLHFVKPRFDDDAYKILQSHIKSYLLRRSKDIHVKIEEAIHIALYGENHPRKRLLNQGFFDEVSIERMKAVYLDRFSNAADFEFYIVGDVQEQQLKPLLEKYIASLPTASFRENFRDNNVQWQSDKIDEDIFLTMEDPKTNVNIAFKIANKYTVKNKFITKALGDILDLRFTEILREQEGGVYSPSVRAYLKKEPKQISYVSIKFDCNPSLAEKLIAIVHAEFSKIAKGEIKDGDLQKTLANYKKERAQAKNNNGYDMNLLVTFYRDGYNMEDPKNFENIINAISKKDIQKLAKKMLKKGKSYEIIIKPKNKSKKK